MVGDAGKLKVDGQEDVLLYDWEQGLKNNSTKVVSYGGWIAITGLPMHWWSKRIFQRIGEACGGLLQVAENTTRFLYLFEAKIKVKTNGTGFLQEFMKLSEGQEMYYVKIRSVSAAIRPKVVNESGRKLCFPMAKMAWKKKGVEGGDATTQHDAASEGPYAHKWGDCLEAKHGEKMGQTWDSEKVRSRGERPTKKGTGWANREVYNCETTGFQNYSCETIGPQSSRAQSANTLMLGYKYAQNSVTNCRKVESDPGPALLVSASEVLKEDALDKVQLTLETKGKGRFTKKYGRPNGDGRRKARLKIFSLHSRPTQPDAELEMESMKPICHEGREEGADGLSDSISSIQLGSTELAEESPRSDSDFADDLSSHEDTFKPAAFEGEEGLLNSFFAPVMETDAESEKEQEEVVLADQPVEPRLLQYKRRRGRRNKHRKAGLPESKKILSLLDISVVPLKRNLLNGKRGVTGNVSSNGVQRISMADDEESMFKRATRFH